MSLQALKDQELLQTTVRLAEKERHITLHVIKHLQEIERRKLYADLKYKTLFDYCVKELKSSEGQAGRRIQAMRLLKEIPKIEKPVSEGSLKSGWRFQSLLNSSGKRCGLYLDQRELESVGLS